MGLVEVAAAWDCLPAASEAGTDAAVEAAAAAMMDSGTEKGAVGLELGLVELGRHDGSSTQSVYASAAVAASQRHHRRR